MLMPSALRLLPPCPVKASQTGQDKTKQDKVQTQSHS
jgi:hypothetical protein